MTIKSSREIDAIFRGGRRYATPLLVALISDTPEGRGPVGRVAFVAGKKLGNAVKRNRCKRLMRAAVRRLDGPWKGKDIVLIARPGTSSATCGQIEESLIVILQKSGVVAS